MVFLSKDVFPNFKSANHVHLFQDHHTLGSDEPRLPGGRIIVYATVELAGAIDSNEDLDGGLEGALRRDIDGAAWLTRRPITTSRDWRLLKEEESQEHEWRLIAHLHSSLDAVKDVLREFGIRCSDDDRELGNILRWVGWRIPHEWSQERIDVLRARLSQITVRPRPSTANWDKTPADILDLARFGDAAATDYDQTG